MSKWSVRFEGRGKVAKEVAAAGKNGPRAVAAGLYQIGMLIMAESKRRVPIDKGILRGTGYVAPPVGTSIRDFSVELGYGTKYALSQHQRHKTRKNFLRGPVDEARSGFTNRLAKFVARNMKKGIGVDAISPTQPKRPKT